MHFAEACRILQIDPNSNPSDSVIKESYRKLSLKWHPDKNVNKDDTGKKLAEDNFKQVNEAYQTLTKNNCAPVSHNFQNPNAFHVFGNIFQHMNSHRVHPAEMAHFDVFSQLNKDMGQNHFVQSVETSTMIRNGKQITRRITKINGKIVKEEVIGI